MGAVLSEPLTFHYSSEGDDSIVLKKDQWNIVLRRLQRLEEVEEELARVREEQSRKDQEIQRLRERNRKLESQLRSLLSSPLVLAASDRTAEAGGVPSSRVFWKRTRRVNGVRRPGGQGGHAGVARPAPEPNSEPMILSLDRCNACGTTLGEPSSWRFRTITELPEPKPKIFRVGIPRYHCPTCQTKVEPVDPFPPYSPYGPMLQARVLHLRMLGLSVAKISRYFEEAHGVAISSSPILKMELSAATLFDPTYTSLKHELLQQPVLGADETGFRIGGKNGWLWAFTHPNAVVYRIAKGRGRWVVREVLEGYTGTLVRDGWKPYDVLNRCRHQLDLLHVNRWLEQGEVRHRLEPRHLLREEEAKLTRAGHPPEEFIRFADGVRRILREAVLWCDQHPHAPGRERRERAEQAYRSMTNLVLQPWRDRDARRISKTLRKRRRMLFTFLTEPGVPFHNNDAETQVRQGVLYRKISGGRRSWAGAWVLERLLTIYRTCQKRKLEFIQVLKTALVSRSAPNLNPTA